MSEGSGQKLVCEWCEETFLRPSPRGPVPRFCSVSHRRAFARAKKRPPDADASLGLTTAAKIFLKPSSNAAPAWTSLIANEWAATVGIGAMNAWMADLGRQMRETMLVANMNPVAEAMRSIAEWADSIRTEGMVDLLGAFAERSAAVNQEMLGSLSALSIPKPVTSWYMDTFLAGLNIAAEANRTSGDGDGQVVVELAELGEGEVAVFVMLVVMIGVFLARLGALAALAKGAAESFEALMAMQRLRWDVENSSPSGALVLEVAQSVAGAFIGYAAGKRSGNNVQSDE